MFINLIIPPFFYYVQIFQHLPNCGSSLSVSWRSLPTTTWSTGRTGRRDCFDSTMRQPLLPCGASTETARTWPTIRSREPWGTTTRGTSLIKSVEGWRTDSARDLESSTPLMSLSRLLRKLFISVMFLSPSIRSVYYRNSKKIKVLWTIKHITISFYLHTTKSLFALSLSLSLIPKFQVTDFNNHVTFFYSYCYSPNFC